MTRPAPRTTLGRHHLSTLLPDDPDDEDLGAMGRVLANPGNGDRPRNPQDLDDSLIEPVHRVRTAGTRELEAVIAFHHPDSPAEHRYPKSLAPAFGMAEDTCSLLLWAHAEMVLCGLNPNHLLAMDAHVPARFPTLVLILALAAGLTPTEVTEETLGRVEELRALAVLRGYTVNSDTLLDLIWTVRG